MKKLLALRKLPKGQLLRKVGVGGFLFFLIKGLAWLAIGFWGASKL